MFACRERPQESVTAMFGFGPTTMVQVTVAADACLWEAALQAEQQLLCGTSSAGHWHKSTGLALDALRAGSADIMDAQSRRVLNPCETVDDGASYFVLAPYSTPQGRHRVRDAQTNTRDIAATASWAPLTPGATNTRTVDVGRHDAAARERSKTPVLDGGGSRRSWTAAAATTEERRVPSPHRHVFDLDVLKQTYSYVPRHNGDSVSWGSHHQPAQDRHREQFNAGSEGMPPSWNPFVYESDLTRDGYPDLDGTGDPSPFPQSLAFDQAQNMALGVVSPKASTIRADAAQTNPQRGVVVSSPRAAVNPTGRAMSSPRSRGARERDDARASPARLLFGSPPRHRSNGRVLWRRGEYSRSPSPVQRNTGPTSRALIARSESPGSGRCSGVNCTRDTHAGATARRPVQPTHVACDVFQPRWDAPLRCAICGNGTTAHA
jgi:hypothetical protein